MHPGRPFALLLLAATAAADDEWTLYELLAPESHRFDRGLSIRRNVDPEGRVACRFVNPRNDEVHVVLRARRR